MILKKIFLMHTPSCFAHLLHSFHDLVQIKWFANQLDSVRLANQFFQPADEYEVS